MILDYPTDSQPPAPHRNIIFNNASWNWYSNVFPFCPVVSGAFSYWLNTSMVGVYLYCFIIPQGYNNFT